MINLACLNCLCIRCKNLNNNGGCSMSKYKLCKNTCHKNTECRPLENSIYLDFYEIIE